MLSSLVLAACAVSPNGPAPASGDVAGPERTDAVMAYVMNVDLGPEDPRLTVHLRADGIDPARSEISLHLPDHGEWTEVDALYLRGLRGEPPVRRDPGQPAHWTIEVPPEWDGSFELSYSIPLTNLGSRLNQRHGLLPWYVGELDGAIAYAGLLSKNTLARVLVGGEPVAAPATIELRAPAGVSIATGWGGVNAGIQLVRLDEGLEDSPIFVGAARVARAEQEGAVCEVVQFAAGEDITGAVQDLTQRLVRAYIATTGRSLDRPVRIFINDKGGGQWTSRGLLVQAATPEEAVSPGYQQLIAHELFHQWLGGYAHAADSSLVWFQEGFTDYLALWHLAMTDRVGRDWFIERLLAIDDEARASAAHGAVAFGDPSIVWRDGNGDNETLAYRGGAILAFCIDAELFRRGGPRLASMIGDLAARGDGAYTLECIRAWLGENGLTEFAATYIDRPGLPSLDAALGAAGYERVEAELGYVGIATTSGTGLGTITAIDPDGPAAASGLRVGDVVGGLWRCRMTSPRIHPEVTTEYRLGLDLFDPAGDEVNIAVSRAGEELTVRIPPRAMAGGYFWRPAGDGGRAALFFDPRSGARPRSPDTTVPQ